MDRSILILEDHPATRIALRKWLEVTFPQYTILEATNAQNMLNQIIDVHPQFILIDLNLSFSDIIRVTQAVKHKLPETKIIMLATCEDECYRLAALDAGANAYVIKHKMYTELVPTLCKFLDTSLYYCDSDKSTIWPVER